ncbi:MAG: hypothetical protein HKN87_19675 [Saprospiraceae bacterium]|nr:hypothetical protein [Saprospiraceae bacterium]
MRPTPKYRTLTVSELKSLKTEFVQFLAAHSITAYDWQKIKSTSREQIDGLIILFSDQILEKVLKDVKLVEKRSDKRVEMFKIHAERITMYALELQNTDAGSWTNRQPINFEKILSGETPAQIIRAEKRVNSSPEREAFELLQDGGAISNDEKWYETLQNLYQSRQSS